MKEVSIFKYSLLILKNVGAYRNSQNGLANKIFLMVWMLLTFVVLVFCYLGFYDVKGTSALLAKKVEGTLTQFQVNYNLYLLKIYFHFLKYTYLKI